MSDTLTYLMRGLPMEALLPGGVRRALWRKEGEGKDLACALELGVRMRAMLNRLAEESPRELADVRASSAGGSLHLTPAVPVQLDIRLPARPRKIHPFDWASMNKQAR